MRKSVETHDSVAEKLFRERSQSLNDNFSSVKKEMLKNFIPGNQDPFNIDVTAIKKSIDQKNFAEKLSTKASQVLKESINFISLADLPEPESNEDF